jgi:hypothetical protein
MSRRAEWIVYGLVACIQVFMAWAALHSRHPATASPGSQVFGQQAQAIGAAGHTRSSRDRP